MTGKGPTDAGRRRAGIGALALAGLLMTAGCPQPSDTAEPTASASTSPSSSPTVAMRMNKPEKLLGIMPESSDRRLHAPAQQTVDSFKKLLEGEPTSTLGLAYASLDEQYIVLVSGVSGTVADPESALDKVFAGLTMLTDVKPTRPGPMGGEARCGKGEDKGVHFDVCAWADSQTIGMVTRFGFPKSGSPDHNFVQLRSQLERPAS